MRTAELSAVRVTRVRNAGRKIIYKVVGARKLLHVVQESAYREDVRV